MNWIVEPFSPIRRKVKRKSTATVPSDVKRILIDNVSDTPDSHEKPAAIEITNEENTYLELSHGVIAPAEKSETLANSADVSIAHDKCTAEYSRNDESSIGSKPSDFGIETRDSSMSNGIEGSIAENIILINGTTGSQNSPIRYGSQSNEMSFESKSNDFVARTRNSSLATSIDDFISSFDSNKNSLASPMDVDRIEALNNTNKSSSDGSFLAEHVIANKSIDLHATSDEMDALTDGSVVVETLDISAGMYEEQEDEKSETPQLIFTEKYFKVLQINGKNISAQCMSCPVDNINKKIIKGSKKSTSNFITHLKVISILLVLFLYRTFYRLFRHG